MAARRVFASMKDYPGGWVLMIVVATALAMMAAGEGWIVSLVLLALILSVPLAKAGDAAKKHLKIPRGLVVFGIPVILVLLVLASLTMGGIQIRNAIAEGLQATEQSPEDQQDTSPAGVITRIIYRPWMGRLNVQQQRMRETIAEWLKSAHTILGQLVGQVVTGLSGVVTGLGVLLVSALIALNPREYYRVFVMLFPPTLRPHLEPVLAEVGARVGRWALARVISATALTAMTIVGLAIVGTPWAVGLGLITGLFSFIPVIGTILAGLMAFLTVLVTQQGSWVGVLIVFAVANTVETYVLLPVLLRRAANIPPGLTIGSLLVMGTVGGLPGMLIASPLVLIITTVAETSSDVRQRPLEPQEGAPEAGAE